jgi:hypothetical protein
LKLARNAGRGNSREEDIGCLAIASIAASVADDEYPEEECLDVMPGPMVPGTVLIEEFDELDHC